jgi:hypothetical protein
MPGWRLETESEQHFYKEMGFRYRKYVNTAVADLKLLI